MATITTDARHAYEALAPHYDDFTAGYDHERWWRALGGLVAAHGWTGQTVLDAACGTGRSTVPLVARGYAVTACDLSAGMLARAETALGGGAELLEADIRDLPEIGPFDLVTCLDDAVNYLVGEDDLEAALRSFARVLAPGGFLVFDANTLRAYREAFARCHVVDRGAAFLCWRGEGLSGPGAPDLATATIEIFEPAGDGLWRRRASRHVQRHHPQPQVRALLAAAGFDVLAVVGQRPGCVLGPVAREDEDTKAVYVARLPAERRPR